MHSHLSALCAVSSCLLSKVNEMKYHKSALVFLFVFALHSFVHSQGYKKFAGTNREYLVNVVEEGRTFEEAKRFCTTRKGILPRIKSKEQNDAVHSLLAKDHGTWLGAERKGDSKRYLWLDGNPVPPKSSALYSNWGGTRTNDKQGIYMKRNGKWFESNYSVSRKRTVCEKRTVRS